jgi:hypothetical protein
MESITMFRGIWALANPTVEKTGGKLIFVVLMNMGMVLYDRFHGHHFKSLAVSSWYAVFILFAYLMIRRGCKTSGGLVMIGCFFSVFISLLAAFFSGEESIFHGGFFLASAVIYLVGMAEILILILRKVFPANSK